MKMRRQRRAGERFHRRAGCLGAQTARKNGLPKLHQKKQRGHAQRAIAEMLRGERTAPHVGPEKQETEHKRNGSEKINRQGRGPARCAAGGWLPRSDRKLPCPPDVAVFVSFLVNPFRVPQRSFVEGRRDFEEAVANQKKKNQATMRPAAHWARRMSVTNAGRLARGTCASFFRQGGANEAVVEFGDAFAAKETSAFRAAGHGLAHGMIEAALLDEVWHGEGKLWNNGRHIGRGRFRGRDRGRHRGLGGGDG